MSRAGVLTRLLRSERFSAAVAAEADMRAAMPVTRRIGFASLDGGAGCTTAATRVALTLSSRRTGRLLLVDASDEDPRRPLHDAPAFDTDAAPSPLWPDGIARWNENFEATHRRYELTLTDWGSVSMPALIAVADHSHVLCIATTMERAAVQRALDAASFMQESGTTTFIVASAVRGRATAGAKRMISSLPQPGFALPFDLPLPPEREPEGGIASPSPSSLLPLAQLGAAIVRASVPRRARHDVPDGAREVLA